MIVVLTVRRTGYPWSINKWWYDTNDDDDSDERYDDNDSDDGY